MRFRIHTFDSLVSTQIEAREGYEAGTYTAGDIITSVVQTGAYGRRGRTWQAPVGNLYFTLIEKYQDPSQLSWMGFAMGLGLYDAVADNIAGSHRLNLKWPNDLLLNEMKFTGLLLEVVDDAILIGVGMNVAVTPETDQPVTCLNNHTISPLTAPDVLRGVCQHYGHWFETGQTQGFAGMRECWLSRAAFKGKTVSARLANGQVLTGTFRDLDTSGVLILDTPDGSHRVTAADIYLHTANSS